MRRWQAELAFLALYLGLLFGITFHWYALAAFCLGALLVFAMLRAVIR